MVNHNPETVSTDYDECNRLYFEELSFDVGYPTNGKGTTAPARLDRVAPRHPETQSYFCAGPKMLY